MSTREEWIEFQYCKEMEEYSHRVAEQINDVWRDNTPASEDILTEEWGEQQVVGQRGQWAVKQILDQWGVQYEEDKIYPDRGDKWDFYIPGFGTIDSKNSQIHNPDIKLPTTVHVKQAQIDKPVDYYVFCKTHTYYRKLWVVGFGRRWVYKKMAPLYNTGDMLDNRKVKRPMHALRIELLYPMSYLRDLLPVKAKSHKKSQEIPQISLF